jgi:cell division protein FtsL
MWFLVGSVVISALFVVNARHQHRLAYLAFQTEESARDTLNDEWGQLLLESNVWASAQRVEKDASKRLAMRPPVKGEVRYIDEAAEAQVSRGSVAAPDSTLAGISNLAGKQ